MPELDWLNLQHELQYLRKLHKNRTFKNIAISEDLAVSATNTAHPGTKIAEGLVDTDFITVFIIETTGSDRWSGSYTCLFSDIRTTSPFSQFEIRYQHDVCLKRDGDSLYAWRSGIQSSNLIRVFKHTL